MNDKRSGAHSFPVTDRAAEDRPRGKLMAKGVSSLSDAELPAVIMRSGSPEDNAADLARKISSGFGSHSVPPGKATVNHLKQYRGMGEAKAVSIAAATEPGRRRSSGEIIRKKQFLSGRDIFLLFHHPAGMTNTSRHK